MGNFSALWMGTCFEVQAIPEMWDEVAPYRSLADTELRPRRQLATPPATRFRMARWNSCGIRKPRPRANDGQSTGASLAEQNAVALDAEFKNGMSMAIVGISYLAVQPRVLAKPGKRGEELCLTEHVAV